VTHRAPHVIYSMAAVGGYREKAVPRGPAADGMRFEREVVFNGRVCRVYAIEKQR
jgi:hypothetical protein